MNQPRPPHGSALAPATIAAFLPSAQNRFATAQTHTRDHLTRHGGYVSVSGGRDSTVVAHLAVTAQPDVPLVWFDSGLEFPDTAPYLHGLAEAWGTTLHVITAEPDALTIMRQAGTWDHDAPPNWSAPDLHQALITTPAHKARALFGHAELWGLRADESQARRALLTPKNGYIRRADGTHTYSPIWAWRDIDITGYLTRHQIPENPAYGRLRAAGATGKDLRVGLALDGNNLHFGRVIWLRRTYPEFYARIEAVLPRVREWS